MIDSLIIGSVVSLLGKECYASASKISFAARLPAHKATRAIKLNKINARRDATT